MADTQCYTKRMASGGRLILPEAKEDDTACVTINGIDFQVKFGSIYDVENPKWIPVVPNFYGGIVMEKLIELTGKQITDHSTKYQLYETNLERMPYVILYIYEKTHRLELEIEEIAKLCPEGSILVFPTIGINNGLSFHDSAFNLFYSIISCLEDCSDNIKKLSKIIITTIFDNNQENCSTRAIRHLFNLVNVYKKTATNKICAICASNKVDTILDCGHYAMCSRCVIDMRASGNTCPLCKKIVRKIYPCYTTIDECKFKCCDEHADEKEMKICVPCGHYNVACQECGGIIQEVRKCPKCDEDIQAYINYYDS